MKQYDFVFNSNGADYTIGPIAGYVDQCPYVVDEPGSMKLLATYGSGTSQCLIVAVCQEDYYGMNVACRGTAPLLLQLTIFLTNLLGSLGLTDILALQPVSQTNCDLPSDTCPPF